MGNSSGLHWLTAASSSSSLYFFPWSIIDSHGSAAGLHLNDDNVKVHSNITFLCGHSGQYKQPVYVTLQQSSLEGCFIIPIFWKLVYKVISFIYSNATSAHNTSAKLSLRHPSITCVAVASFDNGLPETSRTLFSLTCSSYSKYVVLWQQCYVQMQRLRLDLDMIQITVSCIIA